MEKIKWPYFYGFLPIFQVMTIFLFFMIFYIKWGFQVQNLWKSEFLRMGNEFCTNEYLLLLSRYIGVKGLHLQIKFWYLIFNRFCPSISTSSDIDSYVKDVWGDDVDGEEEVEDVSEANNLSSKTSKLSAGARILRGP